jgi:hypothetical protein
MLVTCPARFLRSRCAHERIVQGSLVDACGAGPLVVGHAGKVLPTLAATKSMRLHGQNAKLGERGDLKRLGAARLAMGLVSVPGRAGEHARFVTKYTRFVLATGPLRRSDF